MYKKYASKNYADLTAAGVEADLDTIEKVSIENLDMVEFLGRLYRLKALEANYDVMHGQTNSIMNAPDDYKRLLRAGATAPAITNTIHDMGGGAALADSALVPANGTYKIMVGRLQVDLAIANASAVVIDSNDATPIVIYNTTFDWTDTAGAYVLFPVKIEFQSITSTTAVNKTFGITAPGGVNYKVATALTWGQN